MKNKRRKWENDFRERESKNRLTTRSINANSQASAWDSGFLEVDTKLEENGLLYINWDSEMISMSLLSVIWSLGVEC
jgi:hypothetical protein